MTNPVKRFILITCAVAGAIALGCKADTTGLSILTVSELTALLETSPTAVVCDANTESTRARYGVIPGARLLSNYRDYDPALELPADRDRTLVFYCHSEWCGAAVEAAHKAIAAGYGNVRVLPVGIEGWAEAGQPVDKPLARSSS